MSRGLIYKRWAETVIYKEILGVKTSVHLSKVWGMRSLLMDCRETARELVTLYGKIENCN